MVEANESENRSPSGLKMDISSLVCNYNDRIYLASGGRVGGSR